MPDNQEISAKVSEPTGEAERTKQSASATYEQPVGKQLIDEKPSSLESYLPNVAAYNVSWQKKIKKNSIQINLIFDLKQPFMQYDELKDLLQKKRIPIHACSPIMNGDAPPGYQFHGYAENIGEYTLKLKVISPDIYSERISVSINKKSKDPERIYALLQVIQEYVKLYEKKLTRNR